MRSYFGVDIIKDYFESNVSLEVKGSYLEFESFLDNEDSLPRDNGRIAGK